MEKSRLSFTVEKISVCILWSIRFTYFNPNDLEAQILFCLQKASLRSLTEYKANLRLDDWRKDMPNIKNILFLLDIAIQMKSNPYAWYLPILQKSPRYLVYQYQLRNIESILIGASLPKSLSRLILSYHQVNDYDSYLVSDGECSKARCRKCFGTTDEVDLFRRCLEKGMCLKNTEFMEDRTLFTEDIITLLRIYSDATKPFVIHFLKNLGFPSKIPQTMGYWDCW